MSLLFQFSFRINKKFLLTFKGQYFFHTVGPRAVTFTSVSLLSVGSHCPAWLLEFKPVPLLLVFSGSSLVTGYMFSTWICAFTLLLGCTLPLACSMLTRWANRHLPAIACKRKAPWCWKCWCAVGCRHYHIRCPVPSCLVTSHEWHRTKTRVILWKCWLFWVFYSHSKLHHIPIIK